MRNSNEMPPNPNAAPDGQRISVRRPPVGFQGVRRLHFDGGDE